MPSLVTARADNNTASSSSRPLSRVNSFKREWNDDDRQPARSSSGVIEWSPSPEPQPKPAPPKMPAVVETAQERRRRAIMAALGDGPSGSAAPALPTPPLTARAAPPASSVNAATIRALSSARPQILPDLPSGSRSSVDAAKKRGLPWEEDHAGAKKSTRTGSITSTAIKNRNGSNGSVKTVNSEKERILLSNEQQKVLQLVVNEGKNIFFTGSAGTGKSVLLREIIAALKKKYATSHDAVAVTASTGIAACNIGGITLHSFGGVGLALEEPGVLVSKVKKNKKAASRWTRTKVLIIDEVSMVEAALFDKFNKVGQLMRRKMNQPFGGIQLIVTGDFFQLPPVTKSGEVKFCFDAQTWTETISMSVNLTKVFRQKDPRFIDMLNEMRFGRLTPQSIERFKSLGRPLAFDDGIDPTELFPRREEVDRSNAQRLQMLNAEGWSYMATDGGTMSDPAQRDKHLQNFMAPQSLELRIGAQVMLIKNLDETLVNGSMGRVIGFSHRALFQLTTSQHWKRTTDEEFEQDEEMEEKVKQIRQNINASMKPWPIVQFKIPGGTRDMLVEPDTFKTELPSGEVQVSRNQLPLILAWAMSIHKSQGQTLDRVKVDLGKVFEKGQAYVALSRATSLEGLQVLNFRSDKVMAHPKVIAWSKQLRDLNA